MKNRKIIGSILIAVLALILMQLTGVLNYVNHKDKMGYNEITSNSQNQDENTIKQDDYLAENNSEKDSEISNNSKTEDNAISYTDRRINKDIKNEEIENQPLKVVAVGDILLGRGVQYHIERVEKDYTYPFQYVADILRQGDIVFGDLEAPLTESTHGLDPNGKIVLKSPERAAEGIKYAGFNVLNLANNHIMDYYEKGLIDTITVLDKHEIAYCGAGKNIEEARKPALLEKTGLKIAVLSYTDMAELTFKGNPMLRYAAGEDKSGVAPREYEYIKEDMDSIRENVDVLIISLHWGVENSFYATEEQREFAYKLIDDGADVILGHHPHRFQGVEIYNDKPIIYSLGNFIFDQNDPNNQESFIVSMEIADEKLSALKLIPIRTIDKNHIIIPKDDEAIDMLKRELELCGELGSKCAIVDNIIEFNIK